MNFLNLRHRLLIITLLPSTIIALIIVIYFTVTAIHSLKTELERKGIATVRYLAPVSEYGILTGQSDALQALIHAAAQEPGTKAAMLVNTRGRPLAVSGHPSLTADLLRRIPAEPGIVADSERWVAFGAPVWRSLEQADPLFEPESSGKPEAREVLGCIFIEFDKNELRKQEQHLMKQGAGIILCGWILLTLAALAMADNLAKPVKRLVTAIESVTKGNLETRVTNNSSGEIGILEKGFNAMASHLEEGHTSMLARIEEATAHLAYQARHDDLTGLINRREFEHRLEKALSSVQTGGASYCLLLVVLERFKQVKDACGNQASDELLRQLTLLLQERVHAEDVLARVGGNEFGLLVNGSTTRARQIAESISALANQFRFIWQEKIFVVEISIGLTAISSDAPNITAILNSADAACQEAHASGRNRIVEKKSGNDGRPLPGDGNWPGLIAEGLANNRLSIEAVPLHALTPSPGAVNHVEISARFHLPGQSPIGLPALLDAAERYDLAESIDQRLLDAAIGALSRAQQQKQALCCLVPISRSSLKRTATIDYLASQLASHNIHGDGLCLLIQEDLLTSMTSQVMSLAREIKILGCRLGFDDFGGGLSSFGHLRSIQPDFIKLSLGLTRDFHNNRSSIALLRAIREIAGDQEILLIAEGINNLAMLEKIRTLGVDLIEGMAVAPREPFDVWLEGTILRQEAIRPEKR